MMGRSIFVKQAIGAGLTVEVIAAQGQNGFFGSAAAITVYQNSDTANTMTASMIADNGVTGKVLVPAGSAVQSASTAGKIKANEDFVGQYGVDAGSKLSWLVTNPTAGSLQFNGLLVVN